MSGKGIFKMSVFDFGDGRGLVPAHQHSNGGGWVEDTASVADTVYVAPTAVVKHRAKLEDEAYVGDGAIVEEDASMCDKAKCFGSIGGHTHLNGYDTVRAGKALYTVPVAP